MDIIACVPALNEQNTIAKVVCELKKYFSEVIVFDNNSRDKTAEFARNAGAEVIYVRKLGKGNVVKEMFNLAKSRKSHIFMVDADNTYDLSIIKDMLEEFSKDNNQMIVGKRNLENMHIINKVGNKMINFLSRLVGNHKLYDMLSGIRIIPYKLIKSISIESSQFEVEAEISMKAIANGIKIKEVDVGYRKREEGSFSKLIPFVDGIKIIYSLFLFGLQKGIIKKLFFISFFYVILSILLFLIRQRIYFLFDYTEIITLLASSFIFSIYLIDKTKSIYIISSLFIILCGISIYLLKVSGIERIIHSSVYYILSFLGFDVFTNKTFLSLNQFSVNIGFVCSGMVFLLMYVPNYLILSNKIRVKTRILLMLIFVFGLFILNVFRISFLIIIGAFFSERIALDYFHSLVGVVLMFLYLAFTFFVLNKYHQGNALSSSQDVLAGS